MVITTSARWFSTSIFERTIPRSGFDDDRLADQRRVEHHVCQFDGVDALFAGSDQGLKSAECRVQGTAEAVP